MRTYKPHRKRKEKIIDGEGILQKLIIALENESIKYEVYYQNYHLNSYPPW